MLTRLFPHLLARGVVAEPAKAFGARHGVVNAKLLEEAFVVLLALKQLGVHSNNPRNYDSAVRVCVVLAVQRGLCHPKGQAPDWQSAMRCVAGYADVNPARLMAWRSCPSRPRTCTSCARRSRRRLPEWRAPWPCSTPRMGRRPQVWLVPCAEPVVADDVSGVRRTNCHAGSPNLRPVAARNPAARDGVDMGNSSAVNRVM